GGRLARRRLPGGREDLAATAYLHLGTVRARACPWHRRRLQSAGRYVWTLGETLRQARLDKGVSLADAARDTRIRRAYLEALEAEDAASLPPAVYTRGFLRTYAEYLGLNAQALVDLYQPPARRAPSPQL